MEGLLGKIGKGVQGLLGNPMVQGAAMAATGGASPLLGLLLGPGIKNDRERRELQNQMAREQVTSAKRRNEATEQLRGLLGDTQNVIGPRRGVEGLDGEVIELPGRMSQQPTISTPQGQQQLLGLLSQASPDVFANVATQGLLGPQAQDQERAEPGIIREMRALGFDLSKDGFAEYTNLKRENGATDEMLQTLQLQMQGFQLENLRREREAEEETTAKARRGLEVEIGNTFSKATELAKLNDSLEKTALATGQPYSAFTRDLIAGGAPVLERLGVDTATSRQAVADFDRFNKLATDFGIGLIDRLQGTGAITNTKFNALQTTMAGIGTSPGANRLIIADVLQTALDSADIESIPVNERKDIEILIKSLKASGQGGQGNVVQLGDGVTMEFIN